MSSNTLAVSRYDRQERITWWNQSKLKNSRVLVAGAGALGNEIVKNLAMLGVGHITVVDMDFIENTNLTRCIFFREVHEGLNKAEVLADEASKLNSDVEIVGIATPVQNLGDAYLARFDLILGGLDNREARVWLSASARRFGKRMIDGAIEGLIGKVQVFAPGGPCYACTLTEQDWLMIAKRRSCALLGKDEILSGHTPTNATTSSIIAGVQTQEAVKYLTGNESLAALENRVWMLFGEEMSSFTSFLPLDEECPFHWEINEPAGNSLLPNRLSDLMSKFPEAISIAFMDDFIEIESCPTCNDERILGFAALLKNMGACAGCGTDKTVQSHNTVTRASGILELPIRSQYWPVESAVLLETPQDVVTWIVKGKE